MKFFRKPFQKGMPISTPGFAEAVAGMARAWETLSGSGCRIWWDQGRPKIIVNAHEMAASRMEMFRVFQLGATGVMVRAGAASRWDGQSGNETVSMEVDDAPFTSDNPADTKELNITSTQWIKLEIDDPFNPTELTASGTGSAAIPVSNDGTVIPLAFVTVATVDGVNKITRIFQAHSGPWYLPMPVRPDGKSIDRDTGLERDNSLQLHNFEDAESSGPGSFDRKNDLLGYKDSNSGIWLYVNWYDLLNASTEEWGELDQLIEFINGLINEAETLHSELDDIVGGYNDDDHDPNNQFAGYVRCNGTSDPTGANAGPGRNSFALGSGLGDANGTLSVDVEAKQLWDDSVLRVDWDEGTLQWEDVAGKEYRLDWNERRLIDSESLWSSGEYALDWEKRKLGSDWWEVENDNPLLTGEGTFSDEPALLAQGGIRSMDKIGAVNLLASNSFELLQVLGRINIWNHTNLLVDTSTEIALQTEGAMKLDYNTLQINGETYTEVQADLDIGGTMTPHYVLARTVPPVP